MGRATIQTVLPMSAERPAGPRLQGKKTDRDIAYHGWQGDRVSMARVNRSGCHMSSSTRVFPLC